MMVSIGVAARAVVLFQSGLLNRVYKQKSCFSCANAALDVVDVKQLSKVPQQIESPRKSR